MTDDQRTMYAGLIALRTNETTLRWTRTQLFFLIHSAGLSFVVTYLKFGSGAQAIACALGAYFAVLWVLTNRRSIHWLDYWDFRLVALEQASSQSVFIFGGREYINARQGTTTHQIIKYLGYVFFAIWVVVGMASVLQLPWR
ncbi:hypothetical protein C4552_03590 [Candidatus Parcubacteria bacterium]|nr:MAG: hypothetical protein C4552_03590 [Candidatus Parcubacteria bacterium]